MKVAIYPGSFNHYHEGHRDVVGQALKIFDQVIIAVGTNPSKKGDGGMNGYTSVRNAEGYGINNGCLKLVIFSGLLADYIKDANKQDRKIHAVIRGLRNGQDFEFEKIQQYWNEDLLIGIPTLYFISDRKLVHISSSAIKMVESLEKLESKPE
jgi:pantetheine-phosphate adenylyltransferase